MKVLERVKLQRLSATDKKERLSGQLASWKASSALKRTNRDHWCLRQMESNVFVGVKFSPNGNSQADELYSANPARFSKLPNNYDYILLPITNGRYRDSVRRQFEEFQQRKQEELGQECLLEIKEPQLQELCIPPFNISKTSDAPAHIGLLSSWLELESSSNAVRELSYQVLLNECKYARFVGIDKLIVAPPRELSNLQRYAQIISRLLNNEIVSTHPPLLLSVSLPLYEDSDPLATWELWHTIRKLCDYHPSLTISLAVPRIRTPSHVLNRWLCEPVSCLLVSSSIFATNQYSYPVLHKFNQTLITKFQAVNGNSQPNSNGELCIILHGMEKYASQIKGGEAAYLEYVNYLLKRGDKQLISHDRGATNEMKNKRTKSGGNNDNNESNKLISHSHLDVYSPRLMPPLKPNSENLSNYVYSVFEKDTAKYGLYQLAIEKALTKLLSENRSGQLTILIAGAGRGPLVDRTVHLLRHFRCLNEVRIIALEKNPQACLYLQKRNFDLWNNRVTIIMEDMRQWRGESLNVDLCVSELLGSLGCNELSPECLYAVERFHSKPNTIFIPQTYTSYIAPIASPLLHQKLRSTVSGQDSPWVMHNIPYSVLSSKINELWSFEHPLGKNGHNQFSKNVVSEFKIKFRGELHGLVGFFTAQLYDDITLSTVPDDSTVKLLPDSQNSGEEMNTQNASHRQDENNNSMPGFAEEKLAGERFKKLGHTPDMYSWSPLVFPLKQPFNVTDDTELTVFLSRNYSPFEKKTWYEWSMESFVYLVVSGSPMHKISTATLGQAANLKPQTSKNSQKVPTGDKSISGFEGAAFDSSIPENAFLPRQESVWQSVSDIHGLGDAIKTTAEPMFDLKQESLEPEEVDEEEVHVRVKTGASALHNVNGKSFSIQL